MSTSAGNFHVGRQWFAGSGDPWDGIIDEVRVSTVERDADWISTEYNNQVSGSTFLSLGVEEAL